MSKHIFQDSEGKCLVVTDGIRIEVADEIPGWATLHWYLRDDPRGRPDWNHFGLHRAPNKLSKSDA